MENKGKKERIECDQVFLNERRGQVNTILMDTSTAFSSTNQDLVKSSIPISQSIN